MTGPKPSVEDLQKITILSDLPVDGLEWLAEQMDLIHLDPGEIFLRQGSPADRLYMVFEGELRAERDGLGGDGRVYRAHAGQVTGMLPYSRLTTYPATSRATAAARVGTFPKNRFPELLAKIPILGERLVGVMSDRIRETTKGDLQREKLVALGKLSAGLAHELNNPAAAAKRAADSLREAVGSMRSANLNLDKRGLPCEVRVFLARLECDWAAQAGPQTAMDTWERSELEEEFTAWLKKRKLTRPWDLAAALVDAGCKLDTLGEVAAQVPAEFLEDALTRLTASFTISRLVDEIDSSTKKISDLVKAVKEYSYMDQMPEQEIDIHDGLESTLVMLRHRLKGNISVVREYDRTLPKICARGSELNQVWTNLIGNALDAMDGKGELRIRTTRELGRVLVEILDNGPGIPPEIQDHIFEPFFTTKKVGEGTGLGLDTVYGIVRNHNGEVRFDSQPGKTCFQVRIPLAEKKEENT